jgi:hypothetical protein
LLVLDRKASLARPDHKALLVQLALLVRLLRSPLLIYPVPNATTTQP